MNIKESITFTALLLFVSLLSLSLFTSCTKDDTSNIPPVTMFCKLIKEKSTLLNNQASYEYTYGEDGKLTVIKKYSGDKTLVLLETTTIDDNKTAVYSKSKTGEESTLTNVFQGDIINGRPTGTLVYLNKTGVDPSQWETVFDYDSKNRIIKINIHMANPYPGTDVFITYDDNDNVTMLKYVIEEDENKVVQVTHTTSYDNKLNPFSAIKNWYFIKHALWIHSDPEPLLTALSKNNVLGYSYFDGMKGSIIYTYNEHGFPITRSHTNTKGSKSDTWTETYEYECN